MRRNFADYTYILLCFKLIYKFHNKVKLNILKMIFILFIGIKLFVGNVAGWWPTFPLAGYVTMGLGTLIIKVSDDD